MTFADAREALPDAIAAALAILCAHFNRELDQDVARSYARMLQKHGIVASPLLEAAVERALEHRVFFPVVAEFLEDVEAVRKSWLTNHPHGPCAQCEDHPGWIEVEASGEITVRQWGKSHTERTSEAKRLVRCLLTKGNILAAIAARTQDDPAVADREARQRLWTDIAFGRNGFANASLRDRLKASELLGRSQADFADRHQHEGTISTISVDLAGARERLANLLANLGGKR